MPCADAAAVERIVSHPRSSRSNSKLCADRMLYRTIEWDEEFIVAIVNIENKFGTSACYIRQTMVNV